MSSHKKAAAPAPAPPPEELPKFKGKLPKTLAGCADRLYQVRGQRLALAKQVDEMKAEENALREHLINNLPKSSATGIAGKLARASIESKTVYSAKEWPEVWGYIQKNAKKNPGVWGLLQKRLNEGTCKEMFEAGVRVPGVERVDVPVVSLNKL
jgi:hypothetical protein